MTSRRHDAGCEALEKKGQWRNHHWLASHRLYQFFVLGMFLSGSWFGVWILHDNYSSSLLFDTVPLTDPLMTLQSFASGHLPTTVALTGVMVIIVLYALTGKRLFCSWVCPLNPITDLVNWLRRQFDLNQSAAAPRHIHYVLLVVILVGSALTGTFIREWINPVSPVGRSLVMGFGSGALFILALLLFDLLVVEHDRCRHICPAGTLYGMLGSKGVITVAATDRRKCNRCVDCFHACPKPHVLRTPVLDEQNPVQVTSHDYVTCGRCVDVCSEDVFTITIRRSSGAKSQKAMT